MVDEQAMTLKKTSLKRYSKESVSNLCVKYHIVN